jgi:hypothetical protein
MALADQVALMHDGRLLQSLPPEEILPGRQIAR